MCSVTQPCLALCSPVNYSPRAPLSMRFPRQEYWRGVPFPSLGNLPNPGVEPTSLMSPALADGFFTTSATWEALNVLVETCITGISVISHLFKSFSNFIPYCCPWFIYSYFLNTHPKNTLVLPLSLVPGFIPTTVAHTSHVLPQYHFLVDAKAKCIFIISGVFL